MYVRVSSENYVKWVINCSEDQSLFVLYPSVPETKLMMI